MPQKEGFITTNNEDKPEKVLGMKDEVNGVILVKPEDKNDQKDQKWTVTTVAKGPEVLLMFSINDLVLTGKWNIIVQGNISAETIVQGK